MSDMMRAALSWAARGWKVFPCRSGTKIPFAKSNGVKDATTDAEQIKAWWSENPDANVAIACGKDSGVYVIDIDCGHGNGVDGFSTLKERGLTLPPTFAVNTPSGGMHLYYKWTKGAKPANKNGLLPGVDIRGDGYYVIAPPSRLSNGKSYMLADETFDLAEFPEEMKPKQPKAKAAAIPPPPTPTSDDTERRARLYLERCDPAIQGMSGHSKLMWAAQAMVVGFNLSDETATRLLWDCYNPRCEPPWDRSNKTDRKDIERKVAEARKHPLRPFGWLADESDEAECDFLLAVGNDIAERWLGGKRDEGGAKEAAKDDGKAPFEILSPPGLVGEIAAWINETAGCYQPMFALGAALTLCGAIFGRKVADESDGRTNIYAMGVGHSSSGKDHPATCVAKILHAADADKMLGGQVTSDSAVEYAIESQPSKLFVWDEIGHFLSNINNAGPGAHYLKTIKPVLMELYSSAQKTYIGKQRAGDNSSARTIQQPNVCVWGVTSPQVLFNNMVREELEDGWTARVMTFISMTRPVFDIHKKRADVPEPIKEMVQAWVKRKIPPQAPGDLEGVNLELNAGECWQIVVPTTEGAYRIFDDFGKKAHANMLASDKSGDVCQYLWGKALQNARRVALIVACGKRFFGMEIGVTEARYGCELVEFLIKSMSRAVAENVSESRWEQERQRIRKIIDKAGVDGINKCELTRKTQWVKDKRTRNDYIDDLIEGGFIRHSYDNPAKPLQRNWFWSPAAFEEFKGRHIEWSKAKDDGKKAKGKDDGAE